MCRLIILYIIWESHPDRHEVQRMPATPAMGQPMGLLINLALGGGWPIDMTPNPSLLQVDYVKAFSKQ